MTRNSQPESLPLADFDYSLPADRIAQTPLEPRDAARMMVVDRTTSQLAHTSVLDLPRWLRRGDLLVANNTRVLPARLTGKKQGTGGSVEFLLLRMQEEDSWRALAKPARRLKLGTNVAIDSVDGSGAPPITVEVIATETGGEVVIRSPALSIGALQHYGVVPLPPYITTPLNDAERYQTLHASVPGSAAAPTAGLHFTQRLRDELSRVGVEWAEVTLHVGRDTFKPVTVDDLKDHRMHQEWYFISKETAAMVERAKERGGRVVAVGTTAARTLETYGHRVGAEPPARSGMTDLFIRPGHEWKIVDGLLTNFHLPKSTLLVMISALASREQVLNAYHVAVKEKYRFFSFGDAMLII
jgi:S-adenosylmethionine:tRNA ribosyltransferase-isomerase